ncbi:MAG: glycosyltransferase family 39 protein, partial [Chloroflexota bacterium]
DEPWILSIIAGYVETGAFVDRIMLNLDPEIMTWAMPKHYIAVAHWMEIAGVGIWQGRFYHLVLSFIIILLTSLAAQQLYDRKTALFTTYFMIGSTIMVGVAQFRHEAPLMVSIAASLLLFSIASNRGSNWLHLLAGFVMGLGGFGHLNAVWFGPLMLAGLYGPGWAANISQRKFGPPVSMVIYGVGGMLSGALVLWIVVLPDFEHLAHYFSSRVTQAEESIATRTSQHIVNIFYGSLIEFMLFIFATVVALRRGSSNDWRLLTILILGVITLGFTAVGEAFHYIRLIIPIYSILIGAMFGIWIGRDRSQLYKTRHISIGILILTVPMFQMLSTPLRHMLAGEPIIPPPPATTTWLRNNIACDDLIVNGPHYYYLWLHDAPFEYSSILIFDYLPRTLPYDGQSELDIWNEIQPHYVVVNQDQPTYQFQSMINPVFLWWQGYEPVNVLMEANDNVIIYAHTDKIEQICR